MNIQTNSKGSDQTAHIRSLVRAFAGHSTLLETSCHGSYLLKLKHFTENNVRSLHIVRSFHNTIMTDTAPRIIYLNWIVNSLPTGYFSCFIALYWIFSKSIFQKIFCREYHQSGKQFRSRSDRTFYRTWSGSKLFAKVNNLSADDTSRQRVENYTSWTYGKGICAFSFNINFPAFNS